MGRCAPSTPGGSVCMGDSITGLKGDRGSVELGDSGDELGDGSVMDGESKVEIIVAGDESDEFEEIDVVLLC